MKTELQEPRDLVASALRCLASFERLTAELYERIARKTSNKSVSLVFKWLAIESNSHAMLLNMLTSPSEAEEKSCAEFVGLPWRVASSLTREVELTERLTDEVVAEILRKLQSVERLVAEETYGRIMINLLKDLAPIVVGDAEVVEAIFREISEEERYHEKLLLGAARILEKQKK